MTSSALHLRQATTDVGVFEIIEQSSTSPSSRRVDGTLPLDSAEWASFLDSEGRIHSVNELLQRVYAGGVVPELRRCASYTAAWPASSEVQLPDNASDVHTCRHVQSKLVQMLVQMNS
jgi:hypothetical protein